MAGHQGDLALLDDPVAQTLLQSRASARLAYSWTDGTPRVVPIWFHWTGEEFVFREPAAGPQAEGAGRQPGGGVDDRRQHLTPQGAAGAGVGDRPAAGRRQPGVRRRGRAVLRQGPGAGLGEPAPWSADGAGRPAPALGRCPGLRDPVPERDQPLGWPRGLEPPTFGTTI